MKKILAVALIFLFICYLNTTNFANERANEPDSIRYRFAPVVVTGQRFELPQKDVAASITILSPIVLGQINLNTVADAVSYLVPGVFTTRRAVIGYGVAALAGGSITVRGMGGKPNSQVLMLIDGRPDFQGIFSHPINDAYFLDNVDRIEVLRGPASAVYGTNALGGVVNIITQELPTHGFETKLAISYGSFNTQKYRFQHQGCFGHLKYLVSAGYLKSDGHRSNSAFESQNYAIKVGYQIDNHFRIDFNGSATPYQFQDPGPERILLAGYFDHGDIVRSSMDLTFSNQFNSTNGTIKIHGNFGHHKLSDGWNSDDQTNGIIIFQNFDLAHEIKTTIGFDAKRFGGTAHSRNKKLGTFFNDEYAGYLHLQKVLAKKFILGSGIRYEHNSNFGNEWIPKFSLVYHPWSPTAFRASAAKGFRTPSIKDLFLYAPANPNLKPERLWNYEVGVNQSLGKYLSLDVCSFYYEGDRLIETTSIAPGKIQNQNIGEIQARGFEAAAQITPITNLSANLSYSWLNANKVIPFAPNKFNYMLSYQFNRFNITFYGEHIRELYTSYQLNQVPPKTIVEKLPNYALVNLKMNYRLFEGLLLEFGIENLFDQAYQILKGYPMPGRTLISNMMFSF
ncbi:MAG: TonB-dependent receptor [candidate division KSB1 bacterium]|nr:TonB-dependent receptor [candidate division KSB1 bacterium]MDZ7336407.1 TonB-dependent receptor [candidate division KSB1 bacterium]